MDYVKGGGSSIPLVATSRKGGGGSILRAKSRLWLPKTGEACPINLRHLHSRIGTGGFESIAIDFAWQYKALQYVYDDQEVRFLLGNFVLDDQETRFTIAEFVGDNQEVRFMIAELALNDQETRFLLASYVPKTPMALYWCDTGSGETLVDDSSYGEDGTFKGAGEPAWNTSGREGSKCLMFDGNDYVDLPLTLDLSHGDWTVELWAARSVLSGMSHVLLSQKDGSGTGRTILEMAKVGINYYWTSWVFGAPMIGLPITSLGMWQHAALRYRASDDRLSLVIDGNFGVEQSQTCASLSNDGTYVLGTNKDYTLGYKGKIDSVRFSKYRRSDAQIAAAAADAEVAEPDTRFILANFAADDQDVRFILANLVADDQEVRFFLGNFLAAEQETRFVIANYVTDEQELRFILANYVRDDQALRFILANFCGQNCPVYFYIEGTGIIVYEPAEGYLLDDSYTAARTKVSRLLEVRYTIAPSA